MRRFSLLLMLCLCLSGCEILLSVLFSSSGSMFVKSEWTDKKKRELPLFKDVEIKADNSTATVVLYRPFWRKKESYKFERIMLVDKQQVLDNLEMELFTVLRLAPTKAKFSVTLKSQNSNSTRKLLRKFKIRLEAGKIYFLRWSTNSAKYRKTFFSFKAFQLVDEKIATKELEDMYYLAPLIHKAPVFDKKTGKAL